MGRLDHRADGARAGEFARAGYDYVGFDAQHGYLDDADIAGMLRRTEHLPIGTVVRLPNADAAPIGRVLDAGADAVVIAMIESVDQAAAAVAATRYQPAGIRSFGPLRAGLGRDTAALESRVSVFAMIETAAALSGLDEICAVDGLAGLYVGPADLALSWGARGRRDEGPGRAGGHRANPPCGRRGRVGHRHSRRERRDGPRHGEAGVLHDHPDGRIARAAPGCRRVPARGDRTMTDDHTEIRELLAGYALALDAGDVDDCLELFLPDAEFRVYGRCFAGHDGIGKMFRTPRAGCT